MKLIYAGISSVYALDPAKFLFNCTRNASCQKPYFVPIRSVKDLIFYVDLPGKPVLTNILAISVCCQTSQEEPGEFNEDFNEDFNIGGTVNGECQTALIFDKYVIGQTPNNNWYGVFRTTTDFYDFKRFFFRFIFNINGEEHIFYTQMFELDDCSPLLCLRGCYPNEPAGSSAWDCNGIYYGVHAGEEAALGDVTERYYHKACVRRGAILDTSAKLTLSLFNSKRTYKSILQREKTLEFELVPSFYKDVLLGIFTRGTVEIEGTNYTLQTEQNWKVLDFHSKLWQLDTLLFDECKNYFGCKLPDCVPPSLPCINNLHRGPYSFAEGYFNQEFTGDINAGDVVEWQLLDKNNIKIAEGSILAPPLTFQVLNANPETDCFTLKWRIKCLNGYSGWKEETFGDCVPDIPVPPLAGTFSIFSYGGGTKPPTGNNQCKAQGATEARIRFSAPLTDPITLKLAGYYLVNGNYTPMGGEIIPANHPEKAIFNGGYQQAFTLNIPAGTQEFFTGLLQYPDPGFPNVSVQLISFPACNKSWGDKSRNRFYFRIDSPAGLVLDLETVYDTPAPFNVVNGGILGVTQII